MRTLSERNVWVRAAGGVCAVPLAFALLAAPAEAARPHQDVASAPAGAAGSADNAVNRVVAISVDGLSSAAIRKLGPSRTPHLHRLMRQGASTLNARTAREQTRTLPNHTGMLTGRRIDEDRGGHGIDFNSDHGTTVHEEAGRYVASVFDVVHDNGGSTAMFAAKTKFTTFSRTWNTHGAKDRTGRNDGRAKIDRVTIDENNSALVDKLVKELKSRPRTFAFLHLSLPDAAGHTSGFMSSAYLKAVQRADARVGRVLAAIDSKKSLKDHTLVVLTADHGGVKGKSHSKETVLGNYRIPFLVWGPNVARGANLYTLNRTYRSPGAARTTYAGKQPVRNADLANFVTDALDLPAVRGAEFDSPRTLDAFT